MSKRNKIVSIKDIKRKKSSFKKKITNKNNYKSIIIIVTHNITTFHHIFFQFLNYVPSVAINFSTMDIIKYNGDTHNATVATKKDMPSHP